MADSFIGYSNDLASVSPGYADSRISPIRVDHISLKVLLPFLLILFAIVLVPERPQQLASICERHNPEVVCRVW